MYCNRKNVNILTALLVEHGVQHVVVCPGSRNAPLVHNFSETPALVCHPVTDERSAGFVALGLRQQSMSPVAVCVTSGSALLNVLPAAAEATYQHQGIIVISADRPAAWIDQLDGQTMPQQNALGNFVALSVTIPEVPSDDNSSAASISAWHCNRLVNEAILANMAPDHPSVHINVPISEPLFEFNVVRLPEERLVHAGAWHEERTRHAIFESFAESRRPMIVFGQMPAEAALPIDLIYEIESRFAILSEPISMPGLSASYTDQMLSVLENCEAGNSICEAIPDVGSLVPDWVIYVGGHTVSKRLRRYLRNLDEDTMQIVVSEDGRLRDVSQHTNWLLRGSAGEILADLVRQPTYDEKKRFSSDWKIFRRIVESRQETFFPSYSQLLAVRQFENWRQTAQVYYANSMSVRLAALFAREYCHCNRGLNGIEGSLSVAAGASLANPEQRVYCVIGDLSFFYDQNALWQGLGGNFRILLLNNGQGGIFRTLPGLEKSPVRDSYISGGHATSAEGACLQHRVGYLRATDKASLAEGIEWLFCCESDRPLLLEVCTSAEVDECEFKRLYAHLCKRK